MSLSKSINAQATLLNAVIVGTAYFVSYSLLRRTNAALFGSQGPAFGYTPDIFLSFGYAGDEVLKSLGQLSASGTLVLFLGSLMSLV
ncbi:hypothetical protein HDV05_001891 [Chytridiales sp. JEL 0842]|nr:hypothetical protein HDV05_001891 [Chytridiales sp. JEL 0842]